jgi:ABC-type lipoprotein export system ATPase subunit
MALIQTQELIKHYKQAGTVVRAVDGVSISIEPGEFVSIVGRSGSGKTTMLDLLGLLLRPTAGRLLLDGVDTGKLSDARRAEVRGRRIGFVFQEYNLLPALDVLDNVCLPLRYNGGNRADGRRRAVELLTALGLEDKVRARADQLSGGQQQRVAIARALVNRPGLVLADEPTGALDTDTAAELMEVIRRLNYEEGVAFVIVTHDTELAAKTDRIVRLRDGKVIEDRFQAAEAQTVAV